jgi:hypothetical protein
LWCFLAFGAVAIASAAGAGAGADAIAEAEAAGAIGAAVWLAAKEETANRPATSAAISFFILVSQSDM